MIYVIVIMLFISISVATGSVKFIVQDIIKTLIMTVVIIWCIGIIFIYPMTGITEKEIDFIDTPISFSEDVYIIHKFDKGKEIYSYKKDTDNGESLINIIDNQVYIEYNNVKTPSITKYYYCMYPPTWFKKSFIFCPDKIINEEYEEYYIITVPNKESIKYV